MKKLLTITLMIFMLIITGCEKKEKISHSEYLEQNHSVINLDDTNEFEDLGIINEDIKGKKVILSGGFGGLKKDDTFNLKMIKYLYDEIGLNTYLVQMGYSDSYFLNQYLESGDEDILKQVFLNNEINQIYNEDDYNFYKKLYEFNKTLGKEEQIKVVGIDIERTPKSSMYYINETVKDKNLVTDEIKEVLIDLDNLHKHMKEYSYENTKDYTTEEYDEVLEVEKKLYKDLEEDINYLINDMSKNKDLYEDLYKDEFFGFEIIVEGIRAECLNVLTDDFDEWMIIVENQIYENFIRQDEKIDDGVYFGQFEVYHTNKDIMPFDEDFEPLAYKINESDKYKDQVMSMLYITYDLYNSSYWFDLNLNMFNKYIENTDECMLFNLQNTDSPFNSDKEYIFREDFVSEDMYDKKTPITNHIDYMLLIKGVGTSNKLDF